MSQVLELIAWIVIGAFLAFFIGSLVWGVVQDFRGRGGSDRPPPVVFVLLYYLVAVGFVLGFILWFANSIFHHVASWLKID